MTGIRTETAEALGQEVFPEERADPQPDRSRTRLTLLILLAVGLGLVGGVAGGLWASSRDPEFNATARAAFTEWVDPGAVDAERSRVLASGEQPARDAVLAVPEVTSVEFVTPLGRNFIDVDVIAANAADAERAANAGAEALADSERRTQTEVIDDDLSTIAAKVAELDAQIEDVNGEMADRLAEEAAAKGALRQATEPDAIEILVVEERVAGEEYWRLSRSRNALFDQQNSFVRETIVLETDREDPSIFSVVSLAPAESTRSVSTTQGVLGGALAGLALVLLLGVAIGKGS